jgi:alkanesulfonate monooxygenase SsuD/methylene tetrahydromethanopterin reductase-like flavin-dependent oxidoreductase (luciferase family)
MAREATFGVGLMAPTVFAAERLDLAGLREAAEIADAGGYECLWVGDHLLWHVPLLDAFVSLGVLAAHTKRARIGTNVLQLVLRSPVVTAKAFATLDYLTNGRTILGVGVGGEYQPEWDAAGVNVRQRGARTNEALEMLTALWAGEARSGELYQAPGVPLEPAPAEPIPVWVGGRSEAALKRAARWDGFLGYLLSTRRFGEIRDHLLSLGVDPGTFRLGLQFMTRIEATKEAASQVAVSALSATYGMDAGHMSRYLAAGTPEDVAEFVAGYAKQGLNHASFYCHGPGWREQAQRLTDEVLPLLTKEVSG